MASSTKAHKNRLRRMAERQGFVLQLSRRRDPRAIDFEEWWLVDARMNGIVRSGFGLDTLEHWLEEGEWDD